MKRPAFLCQIKFFGNVLVSLLDEMELHYDNYNIECYGKHVRDILAQTAVHADAGLALMHNRRHLSEPITIEQHLCDYIGVGIIRVEIIVKRIGCKRASAESLKSRCRN